MEQLLEVATRGGGLGHDSPTRTLAVEKFVSELRASSEAKGWNSNNFDFSLRYAEQIERALAQNEIEILNFWLLPLAKRMAGPDGAWPWEGTSRGSLADCAWIEMARSSSEHFATVYFADLETGQLWLEASPLTHARSFGPLGLKLEIGFAHAAHRGDVRYAVLDQYALAGFAEASDFLRLASLARSDFQSLSDAAQASFACAEELPVLLRSVKLSDGSLIDAQGHRLPLLDAQHVSTALQANRVQDENFEVAAASTQSSMQSWSGATTLSSFSLAGDALWTGSLRLSRGKLCFRAFSVLLLAESDRGLIRLR